MSTQSFNQAQKLTSVKSVATVGIKAAAKIAGVHNTTERISLKTKLS